MLTGYNGISSVLYLYSGKISSYMPLIYLTGRGGAGRGKSNWLKVCLQNVLMAVNMHFLQWKVMSLAK